MDFRALDRSIIDTEIFEQILMCDESDNRDFSREVVLKYFSQAEETLPILQKLFKERQLSELSKKGHFLKSSSAVLGVKKVRESCELIQNYGVLKDQVRNAVLTEEQAIPLLQAVLNRLEKEYLEAKALLQRFYDIKQTSSSRDASVLVAREPVSISFSKN